MWHRRLGHASFGYLKKLLPSLFNNIPYSSLKCNVCTLAKSHRASYPSSFNKRTVPFELVLFDIWGPSPVPTQHGVHWFITLVDDCTRMTELYLMKHKSDVGEIVKRFYHMVHTQYSLPVKVLRCDNGGEYINQDFSQFLQDKGLLHETTCHQTPQHNEVAERKNRHILEITWALLIGAWALKTYWADAVTYDVYLMNRIPLRVLSFRTPLAMLGDHVSIFSTLHLEPRVFGCVAYVHLHKNQRSKLDPCAIRRVFIGFSPQRKGYQCYHPPTRHVYFTFVASNLVTWRSEK